MANPHNRKPVYFRSSNPGLGNVDEIASKVFQFDETGSKPSEVLTGAAVMPPIQALNEIMVWSDSNTLGYAGIADAPMFWGDGGAQDNDKILQMINHVAGRKSGLQFYDLSLATDWILSQDDIYTNLSASGAVGGGAYGTADVTVEVRSSQDKISLKSMYTNQGKPEVMLYGLHGSVNPLNNPVAWMPMTNGGSQTINNVDIINVNGQIRIDLQFNFAVSYNGYTNPGKYITYYVNGTLMNQPAFYTPTSIGFYVYPPGGVQNGDEIKLIISDTAGHAPYNVSSGSGVGSISSGWYSAAQLIETTSGQNWFMNMSTSAVTSLITDVNNNPANYVSASGNWMYFGSFTVGESLLQAAGPWNDPRSSTQGVMSSDKYVLFNPPVDGTGANPWTPMFGTSGNDYILVETASGVITSVTTFSA